MTTKKTDPLVDAMDRISRATDSIRDDMHGVRNDMHDMKVVQAKHQTILEEHIRRTELAETAIAANQDRLVPLEKHVAMWAGAGKVIIIAGAMAAIIGAIYRILLMTGRL